ncbi:hypothetical protein PIB30_032933 [Stylosanthes scabra]|uniref:Uncharacterized protein n=1 Tax=Stylosanthes scabra TaxID=79078 RepID=A0ABU6XCJ7_9FABA|nr:hypothetical protein [Stylosanthes scabra]
MAFITNNKTTLIIRSSSPGLGLTMCRLLGRSSTGGELLGSPTVVIVVVYTATALVVASVGGDSSNTAAVIPTTVASSSPSLFKALPLPFSSTTRLDSRGRSRGSETAVASPLTTTKQFSGSYKWLHLLPRQQSSIRQRRERAVLDVVNKVNSEFPFS